MHIEKHIVDNKFPRKSSPCFTSPCFTSPCFTSPCFTSPCFTSPCFTSPCFIQVHVLQVHVLQVHVLQVHVLQVHVLQVHVLQVHVLQVHVLQVHVLQVHVLQVHVLQVHVLQVHVLQVHVLQVHVLQVHVLQVHVLQVQSMVYKSSPIQGPVHVLQHAKTDRCLYIRLKEHSTRENSGINAHINCCEHFQHIKSLMEFSPDSTNTINTNLTELIFRNCKIIDRSDHWSLLLLKESLAIRRRKPDLNHGAKASKELLIFH